MLYASVKQAFFTQLKLDDCRGINLPQNYVSNSFVLIFCFVGVYVDESELLRSYCLHVHCGACLYTEN